MFKFKKSNEENFIKAYENFADAIFRYCYFKVSDRELAKDILQETFTKTWDFISRGGEVKDLRPFLYRVANNLIIDFYRNKKATPSSLEEMRENGIEFHHNIYDNKKDQEMIYLKDDLLKIINKIDESYREVIIMRYIDEIPVKEIAVILDDSENAIYVRIHRGLKKLREILKEYGKIF